MVIWLYVREKLNVWTVPTFKMHNVGTVPTYKMYNIGTVPTFKMNNVGTKFFFMISFYSVSMEKINDHSLYLFLI